VAEVEEGVALRRHGIDGSIVVLLGTAAENIDQVLEHGLTPVVFDLDIVNKLADRAASLNLRATVHVKVDVGMGRLGILPGQVESFLTAVKQFPQIEVGGLLSHLPVADDPGLATTDYQLALFAGILEKQRPETGSKIISHIANSAALHYFPTSRRDMVRPGITLYGCHPAGQDRRWKRHGRG